MNTLYWTTSSKIVIALLVAVVLFSACGMRVSNPFRPLYARVAACQN